VPSSIFSFERAPAGSPGKLFAVALAITALLLGSIELLLRSSGGQPSVALSKSLYASNLEKALTDRDPRTTLILGESRIRVGFSSHVFGGRTKEAPLYYVGTAGESPLAVFLYVAEKTDFSGKLILSLAEAWLSDEPGKAPVLEQTQYIVDYFENDWKLNEKLNEKLGHQLASTFVFRQKLYSITNLINSRLTRGKIPDYPNWRWNNPNGESFFDFTLAPQELVDGQVSMGKRVSELNDPMWLRNLSRLKRAIASIRERGGQVAVVRLPTGGTWWANDRKRWPRDRYWSRIAAAVGPMAIHFLDIPGMKDFKLPDTSHIDYRDKESFTRKLLDALASRGMTWEK
jgi:hypothetical protein